jgi:hypothetical protein
LGDAAALFRPRVRVADDERELGRGDASHKLAHVPADGADGHARERGELGHWFVVEEDGPEQSAVLRRERGGLTEDFVGKFA